MRGDANLITPASMLIMDNPGRIGLARHDRDRTGSGSMRAPDTEADVVVPVVACQKNAIRREAPNTCSVPA